MPRAEVVKPTRPKWLVWDPSTEAEAKNALTAGVGAGYVFAGMYAIGGLMTYATGMDVTTRSKLTDADDLVSTVVAAEAIAVLIGGLAYWLKRRPNVIVPLVLLTWFVVEILVKIANPTGGTHVGWWFMYAFMIAGFVSSARGALFLRAKRRAATKRGSAT